MEEKRNKRNDLISSSIILLIVAVMFFFCAFIALPEILSEKAMIDSNPIEIRSEWNEIPLHPNRLPTYVWVIKVSEGRERVENAVSFEDFKEKFNNNELVRVEYVIEHNKVVLYGDEEISPNNIKLWRAIAIPEPKTNGSVSFSEPTTGENSVIYKEFSVGTACMKMIFALITIFLFVIIIYMSRDIKRIVKDKNEEENNEENDKETRS